jgi:hypothetical protein
MQKAAAGAEQRLGMDRLAIGRVAVERGWRHVRTPAAVDQALAVQRGGDAGWRRFQLGHDVFPHGRAECVGIEASTAHQVDVIEFL